MSDFHPYPYRTPPTASSTESLSLPYADQPRMRLVVSGGLAGARVRVDPAAVALIRVVPDLGPPPSLYADGDTVRLVYADRQHPWARVLFGSVPSAPEIVLHPAVEWSLAIRDGLSDVRFDLAAGRVAGIELGGGCSEVDLELPAVARVASVRISGGASQLIVRRPAGIGVSVTILGGAARFQLDDQAFDAIGDTVLHGTGVAPGQPRYDIAVSGGAANFAIL